MERIRDRAYPFLKLYLEHAIILIVGSYSIGMQRAQSDLDIEMILPNKLYNEAVKEAGGFQNVWVHDESDSPLVESSAFK